MASTWTVRLEQLRVLDADEDGILSDGDEPYFISIGFRSRFKTPGSTQVFWNEDLDDDWASGVDSGDARAIPSAMGVLEFPNVDLPTLTDIVQGHFPEILGVLTIAMESDTTPFGAVRDKVHEIEGVIRDQISALVEQGQINLQDPKPQIAAAVQAARDRLSPSVGEAISLWLQSFGDPDDMIGLQVLVYAAVDQSVDLTGVPKLSEQEAHLDFDNHDGTHYAVDGRVKLEGWRGFELAPAGSASTSGGIAAVARVPDSMELWFVGANGSVQDKFWYDGSPWNGFELAPAGAASTSGWDRGGGAGSRTAWSCGSWGPNGSVQDKFWYDGSPWNGFELAPAGSASTSSSIAAVSRIPTSMELWSVADNGSVQAAYWYEGNSWARYELAPAGSASPTGGIAAVSRIPTSMEVWWIGQNGSVQAAYWYEGSSWARVRAGAGGQRRDGQQSIAAVSRIPNSMELWFVGPNGSVQDKFWYDGSPWNGFELAPRRTALVGGRDNRRQSRIPNSMEVWFVGPNGSVQDKFWYDGRLLERLRLAPGGSASPTGGIAAIEQDPEQHGAVHAAAQRHAAGPLHLPVGNDGL